MTIDFEDLDDPSGVVSPASEYETECDMTDDESSDESTTKGMAIRGLGKQSTNVVQSNT